MASSDDEKEDIPKFISQYYFEDDTTEPISFAVLPVCWNTSDAIQKLEKKIYVRGKCDDGLQLYKPVKAWKFDISGARPEISVLSEKNWIKIQKPRKSYEEFSRTVLVTVNFLHLVKRNPELQGKDLWDKLSKNFCLFGERPSPDDLIDQKVLIEKAVEHDESLRKSKYLMTCLEKNFLKGNKDKENARSKEKNDFIVDDDLEEGGSVDRDDGSGNEEDDDDNMFDSVCSICDEGGSILCCDGVCMRSFHATPEAANEADSKCRSLGFTTKEVEAMETFKCRNCLHKQHQCYFCGLLGSSDKQSGAAEVFQCVNATCGYFYHPGCVAKLLHRNDEDASKAREKDIAAGEPFTCPLHMCVVCRQPGDKTDPGLRMAVCRRCPKAYHQKCLPRKIAFEDDEDPNIVQRAWDNLLADRILIYCLKHEIDEDLGTPRRNHIKFPGIGKKESQPIRTNNNKTALKSKKPSVAPSRPELKRSLSDNHSSKIIRKISKPKCTDTLRNMSTENKPLSTKVELKSENKPLSTKVELKSENKPHSTKVELRSPEPEHLVKPKTTDGLAVKLDSDSQRRILKIIEEASSRITMDHVIQKHDLSSVRDYKQQDFCKSITEGKVVGSCEGIRAASKKLAAGGSIEDAKAICDPKVLDQVVRWKGKFKVYLSPFIYGMRYTSFGRHFTKTDKLQEIAEKIHWYIKSNDTIVDFCCGANEFSLFMKNKLESTGKTCNYNNYDLFPPKDDFCFEKKSWFDVQPKELPPGNQLIIGLNPPFGVKASRANQFINKALEFKPKLLILIVPQETERLDRKKKPYDLIWEDRDKLSGKSFYLPGSVDVNDKQMEDWNVSLPVLYLWSRHDWTDRHKAIADEHGHLHRNKRNKVSHKNKRDHNEIFPEKFEPVTETKAANNPAILDDPERLTEKSSRHKRIVQNDHPRETHLSDYLNNIDVNEGDSRRKRRHSEEIYPKLNAESSSHEYKRHHSSPFNPHQGYPHHSPASIRDGTLSPPSTYQASPPNVDIMDPTSFGDRMYSRESQQRGYEDFSSGIMNNINEPITRHPYDPSILYGDTRNRLPTPSGLYDDRVGQIDEHPGGRWSADAEYAPPPNYPSRVQPEWAPTYMRGPEPHLGIPPYSEPEQRFRQSGFPAEAGPGYGRMSGMSSLDGYDPGFGNTNGFGNRMSGHEPEFGHHPVPGVYNQAQRFGRVDPMHFASRPVGPYHHPPHSSSGGWIND